MPLFHIKTIGTRNVGTTAAAIKHVASFGFLINIFSAALVTCFDFLFIPASFCFACACLQQLSFTLILHYWSTKVGLRRCTESTERCNNVVVVGTLAFGATIALGNADTVKEQQRRRNEKLMAPWTMYCISSSSNCEEKMTKRAAIKDIGCRLTSHGHKFSSFSFLFLLLFC